MLHVSLPHCTVSIFYYNIISIAFFRTIAFIFIALKDSPFPCWNMTLVLYSIQTNNKLDDFHQEKIFPAWILTNLHISWYNMYYKYYNISNVAVLGVIFGLCFSLFYHKTIKLNTQIMVTTENILQIICLLYNKVNVNNLAIIVSKAILKTARL
jgi:hypothetical protein